MSTGTGFNKAISLASLYSGLKHAAAVIAAIGVIYGAMVALGAAPVTVSQAKDMIIEIVDKNLGKVATKNQMKMLENKANRNQRQIEVMDGKVEVLQDQTSRIDERTQQILRNQELLIRELRGNQLR